MSDFTHIPGLRREGDALFLIGKVPPTDWLCLNCSADVQEHEVPYYEQFREGGKDYVLCWDCGAPEWRREVREWEETIPEDDPDYSQYLRVWRPNGELD